MEINFFLDNQQIKFEKLTTDINLDGADEMDDEVSKMWSDKLDLTEVEKEDSKATDPGSDVDEISDNIFDQ